VVGALALAVLLAGCTNFGGGTSNSGAGGTISHSPDCQQRQRQLSDLAGLSYTNWNKPISELPPSTRDALLADGFLADQTASAAYVQLVGSPEWHAC
jgi:hypothetical protein